MDIYTLKRNTRTSVGCCGILIRPAAYPVIDVEGYKEAARAVIDDYVTGASPNNQEST
ncbi:hypothetical protein A2U01_0048766, partial [Trifolium medium]|nr:hypothetical protein [Trifolium medium]